MANPRLSQEQLEQAHALLADIRRRVDQLAGDNDETRFAFIRKLAKELTYVERGKPMVRRALKARLRKAQGGLCASCRGALPERGAVADRHEAIKGYTDENVQLICANCDAKIQAARRFR